MFRHRFLMVSAGVCAVILFFCFFYKPQYTASPVYYQKTVLIDAGHGYPDGGAVGNNGTIESDINLDIALELKELLEKSGFYVILTRSDENTPAQDIKNKKIREIKREDLSIRRKMRDEAGADFFVSIHQNKFTDSKYSGAQVFYSPDNNESREFGETIQRSLIDVLDPNNNRSAKEDAGSIFILKNAKIPSVLIECGFLSNDKEEKLLNTEKYRQKIAWAIFCGMINYIG